MADAGTSDDLVALLQRVGGKDRAAFQALYTRTSGKLFGVICRICANREVAKEVLQETYVTVWQKAGQYDPAIAAPISWMARIARNRAIDMRRLRAERISEQSEPADGNEASPALDPEAAADRSDAMRRIKACLDALPSERRDMVLLAYYSGWSREELAEKYGRPLSTVKTTLRRCLASLRECLDGRN